MHGVYFKLDNMRTLCWLIADQPSHHHQRYELKDSIHHLLHYHVRGKKRKAVDDHDDMTVWLVSISVVCG